MKIRTTSSHPIGSTLKYSGMVRGRGVCAALRIALLIALLPAGAMAVTKTWNNSGGTDWNTGANWTTTGVPVSADDAVFSGAAVANANISTSTTVTKLVFALGSSGYTISAGSGQTLTLTSPGGGGASMLVANNTSGINTFTTGLILGQGTGLDATISQAGGGTLILSGNISSTNTLGFLQLQPVTNGFITLSGNNTYLGNTNLLGTGGTVNVNSATAFSSGTLSMNGSSLANTSGAAITMGNNNNITNNGTVTFNSTAGTGDLSFGSGTMTINGGDRTVVVSNVGSTLTIGSLNADTTARTTTIGSLLLPSAGKLAITGAAGANLQGNINFFGGVVELGNKSALGTGTLVWQTDHSLVGTKTLQASTDLTGANAVANNMTLGQNGNNLGPAFIGGNNAIEFSGTITSTTNARQLTINNTALTTFSGNVVLNPTIAVFNLTLNGSGGTLMSGAISGMSGMIYAGTGKLTLSGANTYTGLTTVSSGTLQLAKQSALYNGNTASWTAANIRAASGGTLAFNVGGTGEFTTGNVTTLLTNLAVSTNATTNGMAAGSNLGFDTTNASGGTFTIANVIANTTGAAGGARGLTKLGSGTLVLSNANTYTGATTVNAGTLLVNGSLTSNVVVNGGKFGGTGSTTGSVTVNAGGTASPGASVQSLATGALTLNNSSTFEFELDSGAALASAADLWVASGNLSLGSPVTLTITDLAGSPAAFAINTTFSIINYTGTWNSGLFTYNATVLINGATFTAGSNTWQINYNANAGGVNFTSDQIAGNFVNLTAVVPEPSVLTLLMGGMAAMIFARRRRRC